MKFSIKDLQKAVYHLHLAQHLLEVTYPLVKDSKMLLSVLSNLEQTHNNLFDAVLPLNLVKEDTSFIAKLNSFEDLLKTNNVINQGSIQSIKTVHNLLEDHNNSGVVFSRKDSFIICDDEYGLKKINELEIRNHIHNTKNITKQIFDLAENADE